MLVLALRIGKFEHVQLLRSAPQILRFDTEIVGWNALHCEKVFVEPNGFLKVIGANGYVVEPGGGQGDVSILIRSAPMKNLPER